jgi:hypothetical protein
MSVQQRKGLYLLPNAPLNEEELAETRFPMSEISEEKKRPAPSVRDTMIELLDKTVSCDTHGENKITDTEKKAELQLFGSEKHMATIQDLSNLLYTRGRLQELGCTFTTMGELVTYGYPVTLKENEQLFRLGPIYDEQWSFFFSTAHIIRTEGDAVMWADIRTLKRVLVNEGVIFDYSHRRLTHGDGNAKLIRLCTAYDNLHKLWSSEKPTHVLTPIVEKKKKKKKKKKEEEEEADEGFDDSGCFLDEGCSVGGDTDAVTSTLVGTQQAFSPIVQREHELAQSERRHRPRKLGPTQPKSGPIQCQSEAQPEPATTYCDQSNRSSSLPRNIGWRFSDDIVRRRDSLSDDGYNELEGDLKITIQAPLQISEADLARLSCIVQSKGPKQDISLTGGESCLRPVSHNRWPLGPSPLKVWCGYRRKGLAERLTDAQNYTTTGIISTEQPQTNSHDSTSTSSDDDLKMYVISKGTSNKKKGFRGWWREVFGRMAS